MGHMTVLVIGNDAKDQLDKFQRNEYADPKNRHFVVVDALERVKRDYLSGTKGFLRRADGTLHDPYAAEFWRPLPNGGKQLYVPENYTEVRIPLNEIVSFRDWATNGVTVLAEGQEPDIHGRNTSGWVRVNASGEIIEIVDRTIPGGFFDWFEETDNRWKLKPGAVGCVIRGNGCDWIEEPATDGYAGSARKDAIDLDGMRNPMHEAAADWWDCAASASGSKRWEPFEVIWKKYERDPYSSERQFAAIKEWVGQPAVEAIMAASRLHKPHYESLSSYEVVAGSDLWNRSVYSAIDLLRLPRNEYVKRHGLRVLLGYCEVIRDGELLKDPDEGQLYDSIPEDAVLTLAAVHC